MKTLGPHIEGDQLYMALFSWYLAKSDLSNSNIYVYCSERHLQKNRKTRHVYLVGLYKPGSEQYTPPKFSGMPPPF